MDLTARCKRIVTIANTATIMCGRLDGSGPSLLTANLTVARLEQSPHDCSDATIAHLESQLEMLTAEVALMEEWMEECTKCVQCAWQGQPPI